MIIVANTKNIEESDTAHHMDPIAKGLFQDHHLMPLKKQKNIDVGPSRTTTEDILSHNEVEHIVQPHLSRQEEFENEMKMRMDTLSMRMGTIHTLYESMNCHLHEMDERGQGIHTNVTALLSMVRNYMPHIDIPTTRVN